MLIRCKIEREGGTVVEMDDATYHFKPIENGGPHIADVTIKGHVARFLAIPEGYEVMDGALQDAGGAADAGDDMPTEGGSDELTNEQFEALSQVLTEPEDATDDDVALAYEGLIGRKPHAKAKRETLIDRVREEAIKQGYAVAA